MIRSTTSGKNQDGGFMPISREIGTCPPSMAGSFEPRENDVAFVGRDVRSELRKVAVDGTAQLLGPDV
jgi:hypothetical protein